MRSSVVDLSTGTGTGTGTVAGDAGPVDPEAAREAARDILSGAEYSEPEPGPVERVIDWVFERIGSFFGTLTGGGPGSAIGWLVVLVLVAGAAFLIVRALRVPLAGRGAGEEGLQYGTETRWDPSLWLEESERLARDGDRRGALRCRHQAMLATMVSEGVVDDVPGRTAGEYGSLLGARLPDRRADVDELTDRFHAAWYGGAPVTDADLERFRRTCGRVETAVPDGQRVGT